MGEIIQFNQEKKKPRHCAFCKKTKEQVSILIGEEGKPAICSECVAKCKDLLKETN